VSWRNERVAADRRVLPWTAAGAPCALAVEFGRDPAPRREDGLRGRVEQGRSGGGLCYGCSVVENAERGGREIVQDEAVVVRRIFAEFAAGTSQFEG
jgi:hypothetical protein